MTCFRHPKISNFPFLSYKKEKLQVGDWLSIVIRRVTVNDLERLCEIERECFTVEAFTKEQIRLLLDDQNAVGLIALLGDEVAGFIIGLIHHHDKTRSGHVCTIDVAVKHRRKGVGLKLLNELEKAFVRIGVKTCYLEARVDNVAAHKLYRKQGYVEVERLKNYYHAGIHGILFAKRLS